MKSIISNEKKCLLCGAEFPIHKHHIFGGSANRKLSEEHGCWCYLCQYHHNGSNAGVHFNRPLDLMLKQYCQQEFEKLHGHEEFMRIFGRNYIEFDAMTYSEASDDSSY